MNKKSKYEYLVLFQGTKNSKREASKAGTGIFFDFFGVLISVLFIGLDNKISVSIICFNFVAVGYFLIGNKLFKT